MWCVLSPVRSRCTPYLDAVSRHYDLSAYDLENRTYTVEEWQEIERRTGERFEYHQGRLLSVSMMAGGTHQHSRIGGNIIGAVYRALYPDTSREHCGVHSSDLQIYVPRLGRYLYADATVVCGEPAFDARVPTAITNPVVVVEVLSSSSAAYDAGVKFDYYSSLPSLRDYVVVSQEDTIVEVRSRGDAGDAWTFAFAQKRAALVRIPSVGVDLALAEVYRGIAYAHEENGGEERPR